MIFISATRLRLRSFFYLPQFFWGNAMSSRQLAQSPGFLGGRLLVDRRRTFWTVTAWADEAAMRQFRHHGAHRQVMPKLLDWCDEAALVHWYQETAWLPDWPEIYRRMISEGKLSKVHHPSPQHATKDFPEPRVGRLIRAVKPAVK